MDGAPVSSLRVSLAPAGRRAIIDRLEIRSLIDSPPPGTAWDVVVTDPVDGATVRGPWMDGVATFEQADVVFQGGRDVVIRVEDAETHEPVEVIAVRCDMTRGRCAPDATLDTCQVVMP